MPAPPLSTALSCSYQCCDNQGHSVCPSIATYIINMRQVMQALLNGAPGAAESAQQLLDEEVLVNTEGK